MVARSSDESNSDGEGYEQPFDDSGSIVHLSDSGEPVRSKILNLEAEEPMSNPIESGSDKEGVKINHNENYDY